MTRQCPQVAAAVIGLVLLGPAARAQEVTFGDWVVGQRNDITFARTVNDREETFSKTCGGQGCRWLLFVDLPCGQVGAAYSVLVNSNVGNGQTTMVCLGATPPAYAFEDSELIERVMDRAAQLSVAIPLANGLMGVSRFSLKGAPEAVARLASKGPDLQCAQLSAAYSSCTARAKKALQECTVWPGPGKCPYSVPVCYLPSTIKPGCSP